MILQGWQGRLFTLFGSRLDGAWAFELPIDHTSNTAPVTDADEDGVDDAYDCDPTDASVVLPLADDLCGNGIPCPARGEVCDDGFTDDCGACNHDCSGTGTGGLGFCGDGILCLEGGEECDDGNLDLADDCPDGPSGMCEPARCGDGHVAAGEELCDDGEADSATCDYAGDRAPHACSPARPDPVWWTVSLCRQHLVC